jgi:hypothetical protein
VVFLAFSTKKARKTYKCNRLLAYCKNLCPGAFLIDGYLDNDFTIVMQR